jgi:hypothetical protein
MSALGQKRTLRLVRLMSALPPKADIAELSQDVRQKQTFCAAAKSILDYLISLRRRP